MDDIPRTGVLIKSVLNAFAPRSIRYRDIVHRAKLVSEFFFYTFCGDLSILFVLVFGNTERIEIFRVFTPLTNNTFIFTHLSRMVNCRSWPMRSSAQVPSTRIALILSRNVRDTSNWPWRSFSMSRMLGWRRKATT